MFRYFFEGGVMFMCPLTIVLIGILLAAWKAPAWVKELGLIALVIGILGFVIGMYQIAEIMQQTGGEFHYSVYAGGFKVTQISLIYGLFIYLASLVIRIIQKPRLL